mmetsp:Transcript_36406/g.78686  ORF Transcript_36406/g.78686 Transcript_36406/m.78686 type:complete len:217 (+) Transcript_36406:1-651(+)
MESGWEQDARWGSSELLRQAIVRAAPRVHLFGHVHEQRGVWVKIGPTFRGGVEYHYPAGAKKPLSDSRGPPASYPPQIISCAAMNDHCGLLEGTTRRIGATPRAFTATATQGRGGMLFWSFETCYFGSRCRNTSCVFSHPSPRACVFGPDCTNRLCRYWHPPGPSCKFGFNCSNEACRFSHPQGAIPPCRFGGGCTNPRCVYLHPERQAVAAGGVG